MDWELKVGELYVFTIDVSDRGGAEFGMKGEVVVCLKSYQYANDVEGAYFQGKFVREYEKYTGHRDRRYEPYISKSAVEPFERIKMYSLEQKLDEEEDLL